MKKLQWMALLLLLVFLCGCAAQPAAETIKEDMTQETTVTPPEAEEPAAPEVEELPLEVLPEEPEEPEEPALEPGLQLLEDGLYFVEDDGTFRTDGWEGYLYFGEDGRYTTGNEELDTQIQALLATACPDEGADQETRLRAAYDYIRENYRYLSMPHYEAGSTDWAETAALAMLSQGKGNCYCFTALFTYCARQLGYQAYHVAGHEYSETNDHAWTMIDWPDGETYLFDVQLEYAYLYMYEDKPAVDMFKASGSDGVYNGFLYFFP